METLKLRSDLAIEAVESFFNQGAKPQKGVKKEVTQQDGLILTQMDIEASAEEQTGKKAGRYISIDTSKIGLDSDDNLEMTRGMLSKALSELLAYKGINAEASCLVVGLGNEHITPDALGPLTMNHMIVTRHLYEIEDMPGVDPNYRKVSALVPGVMGLTGIETYDIIESVVKKIQPDFVIVVDALAARAVGRVNQVIQMTDTGISPGSGVGNKRKSVDEASLGVPVIAIGIPTVVDAVSVTVDAIEAVLAHLSEHLEGEGKLSHLSESAFRKRFLGRIGGLEKTEQRGLLEDVLTDKGYNLIVTPKTIDSEIQNLSRLLSNALNVALHPKVEFEA